MKSDTPPHDKMKSSAFLTFCHNMSRATEAMIHARVFLLSASSDAAIILKIIRWAFKNTQSAEALRIQTVWVNEIKKWMKCWLKYDRLSVDYNRSDV